MMQEDVIFNWNSTCRVSLIFAMATRAGPFRRSGPRSTPCKRYRSYFAADAKPV